MKFFKIQLNNDKYYNFYHCSVKTSIVKNSRSHRQSVFDRNKAHGPDLFPADRKRSDTGIYNKSLNEHINANNHYHFHQDRTFDSGFSDSSSSNIYDTYSIEQRGYSNDDEYNNAVNSYAIISNNEEDVFDSDCENENWFSLCIKRNQATRS